MFKGLNVFFFLPVHTAFCSSQISNSGVVESRKKLYCALDDYPVISFK